MSRDHKALVDKHFASEHPLLTEQVVLVATARAFSTV
jgi:hypothetical protein